MSVVRVGMRTDSCRVLGPGDRAVLWVHGCERGCPGCIGVSLAEGAFEEVTPQELANWYLGTRAEGLTISGGEPMLQAAALAQMVQAIRMQRDCGTIVYTGYTYEELQNLARTDEGIAAFLRCIDLLVDGPYVEELNDNVAYRGSSNQRLIALTDRYRQELRTYYEAATGREVEMRLAGSRMMLVGVPGREQAAMWREMAGRA